MKSFEELLEAVQPHPVRRIAVAAGHDKYVIEAAAEARKQNIAETILVGDESQIRKVADEIGVSLEGTEIMPCPEPVTAAAEAVRLVSSGKADIVMKGFIHTDDFLRAVLNKEYGLRTGSIMSHVFVAEIKEWNKLIFVSDAAMNITPDLEQKAAILLNAVHLAKLFGVDEPKVAALAAVELVNPAMPATMDAAALGTMAKRSQYVPSATVDGPFGLDSAISIEAAQHKGIGGPVAGQADVLIVPDIEAGNIFVKSLVHFGGRRVIGLLVGAKVPVVLTSRTDTMEAKLLSMAGAVLMVNQTRATRLKIGKVHF
jgi:phosphate butyryltransferase